MQLESLPGRVIHIRMDGAAIAVTFAKVPWPFFVTDITGALEAFNNNDWHYFECRWWASHQHLKSPSPKLTTLASTLDPNSYYAPITLIQQALELGLYTTSDRLQLEWDQQRLTLAPLLHGWPIEGLGLIRSGGTPPTAGWPGKMWSTALLNGYNPPDMKIPATLYSDVCTGDNVRPMSSLRGSL